MKKVLIITYYWPPGGGVAVQRWVKMARYFRSFGWEPLIYTAQDGEMPVIDTTLEATLPEGITVIRQPIREPYSIYKKLVGFKKGEQINAAFLQEKKKKGMMQNLSIWVRGNFFIPDARMLWIKPSVRFLSHYLQQHPVDAIVSTGPPHTMHMIAMGVKEATGIPWIADFRDPWTKIDYYHELKLSKRADKKHHAFEKAVVNAADKVVTVSRHWANDFNVLNNGNTEVITNSFDENDFTPAGAPLMEGFILHHVGMINKARNPELFWKALRELCDENPDFKKEMKVMLTGKTDFTVAEHIEKYQLGEHIIYNGQLPHHEAIRLMRRSAVLLLLLNDTQDILGRIPAKVFEYLAARRPILAVGNIQGDAADIIVTAGAGVVADLHNGAAIKSAIAQLFLAYTSGNLQVNPKGIEQYSGKQKAKEFTDLLNALQSTSAKN